MESSPEPVVKKSKAEMEEALQNALDHYKKLGGIDPDGKVVKINGKYKVEYIPIARKFGISRITFFKTINNCFKGPPGFQSLFNKEEEKTLIQFIKLRGLLGQPINKNILRLFAKELLIERHHKEMSAEKDPQILAQMGEKTIKTPCAAWALNFFRKHGLPFSPVFPIKNKKKGIGKVVSEDSTQTLQPKEIYENEVQNALKKLEELTHETNPQMHSILCRMKNFSENQTIPRKKKNQILKNKKNLKSAQSLRNPKKSTTTVTMATPNKNQSRNYVFVKSLPSKSLKKAENYIQSSKVIPIRETHSGNFSPECQRCLKRAQSPTTIWITCNGQCGRWFHHSCIPELESIAENIEERIQDLFWLCPICEKWGPFLHLSH